MEALPSLDAHAHLDVRAHPEPFDDCGIVLALTMSLAEADLVARRRDATVTFGIGCHPRLGHAQAAFDIGRFAELATGAPVAGEIGLDAGSRVPWERQLATFRAILGWRPRTHAS